MNWTRAGLAGVVAAAGLAGVALSISASQPDEQHLVLRQQPPDLHTILLQEGDRSIGDLLLFDAPFATEDGTAAGELTGSLLVVDLADPAAEGDLAMESRLTNLVFSFGERGTIVVGGGAVYPALEKEIAVNDPQVRAVVGGTGEFIGASGEVTTTRAADGSYTHDFTLLDAD